MDNTKDDAYYLAKIINDLLFVIEHTNALTYDKFKINEILIDSVMFRLIQISENSDRLSDNFKSLHNEIQWRAMKGMRNRIVHNYGDVDFGIVFDTVSNDVPKLYEQLLKIKPNKTNPK